MSDNGTLWPLETPSQEGLADGVVLLRNFCGSDAASLLQEIDTIAAVAPFRQLTVPGGHTMSVAMTNTGTFGWTSDRAGYRYTTNDPLSDRPWQPMPRSFLALAELAATEAGFAPFTPNACLINRYAVGAKLSLHQDKDELDYTHPIVSVSLGLPATFLLGSLQRSDTPRRIRIESGDVMVWGGPARLIYHGVAPIRPGSHPLTGSFRINLTFRCVMH
ncbi:MAG: DNA oxidative demethylase AlkB [Edaphobacter sp.]|uniref:DNA oxidative demethylase AlkB n=1 Tax=Edaphobacter sp. TaxID=1934404 RepID=UPI00239BF734|nr:DNA oxidative demethylase AlkB [Edaphobacter sp.]MDE1177760.1 DNA oxidative demethylase AlkB [Edaphobacter sp.]